MKKLTKPRAQQIRDLVLDYHHSTTMVDKPIEEWARVHNDNVVDKESYNEFRTRWHYNLAVAKIKLLQDHGIDLCFGSEAFWEDVIEDYEVKHFGRVI